MTTVKISVKWSGKKFDDILVNLEKPATVLKQKLYELTSVEPGKQKIMVKGGMLKDDADLKNVLVDGQTVMMMGTPGNKIPLEPVEKPTFLEDMSETEINVAKQIPPGLENLGNTCYMNATLQCLHSIPELSVALNRTSSDIPSFSSDSEKNVTVSMRELFKHLNDSGRSVNPLVFLQAMRARFPQFNQQERGVFMQQDAEECFSALVATLEHTTGSVNSNFVNKYMTGLVEQSMKCDDAPVEVETKTVDKFYRLNCHISHSVNFMQQGIHESLKESIEKNSPTLNSIANYTRTSKLIRLPKYLTVSFVRFFWKQETRVKAKIMRAVKFPLDFDVNEFCSAELQEKMKPARDLLQTQIKDRQELKKRRNLDENELTDSVKSSNRNHKEVLKEKNMDADLLEDEGANIHGQYELISVLTHVGRSADAGHYMAWVRNENEADEKKGFSWWKFDDDKVSTVSEEDILKLYGGGDWHMAYLLLYKAKEFDK